MAVAFAGIANNGITCSPDRDRQDRRRRRHRDVPVPQSTCTQSVDADGRRRHGRTPLQQVHDRAAPPQQSYWRHHTAGADDRQDRNHRRQQGHLDERGEHARSPPSSARCQRDRGRATSGGSTSTAGTPPPPGTGCGRRSCRSPTRSTAARVFRSARRAPPTLRRTRTTSSFASVSDRYQGEVAHRKNSSLITNGCRRAADCCM